MQSTEPSSVAVTGALQTSAFANPLRVRVLMACALEECSLSTLQERIEAPLAKLHYHVSRLLKAKLVTVSRTQSRAGRAIKFYRAIGDSFIVPPESLPALPGDRLAVQLRQSLRDEQGRSGELSMLYTPGPGGKMLVTLAPREPHAPSRGLELWRVVKLSAHQRVRLATELSDVFSRYADAEPEPGAIALVVHAAFAPQLPGR